MAIGRIFDFVSVLLNSIGNGSRVVSPLEEEYRVTIEPLLLREHDSPERFFNHLWYTIIDQRRDVRNIVIPIMASLMIAGFNIDFALENPEESVEILAHVLSAYGHELKIPSRDIDRLIEDGFHTRTVPSRSQAIVKTIHKLVKRFDKDEGGYLEAFKKDMLQNRAKYIRDEKLRKEFVSDLPLVGTKSFYFFLRDIVQLTDPEAVPIPVDTNVAQSIQKTGLMFDSWPPELRQVIPVVEREKYTQRFEERIRYLVSEDNPQVRGCGLTYPERIVRLSQTLFLLGSVYCQNCPSKRKGELHPYDVCPYKESCMLALNADKQWIEMVLERIGEK